MIKLYTDAAFNPKTYEAGIGIQIASDNIQINRKIYLSNAFDNHWAEFVGLLAALNYIEATKGSDQIIQFNSDSKILIESLEKKYSKHVEYKQVLELIMEKVVNNDLFFPKWIPESENKGADTLAKQALRLEGKIDQEFNEFPIDYSKL